MRELNIIREKVIEDGRTRTVWVKQTGLVKNAEIAGEVMAFAGWLIGTDHTVCVAVSDDTFFDSDFEETQAEQALIGNTDYGYMDGDSANRSPVEVSPNSGESWIFALGEPLHLN